MLKNICCLLIIFSISQTTLANVIELDNLNPIHCKEQLVTSGTELETSPVVMVYIKGCPWAAKLRDVYEQVSTEYPARRLFAFDFFDPSSDAMTNQVITRTAIECLGTTPYASPELYMYNVIADICPSEAYINGFKKIGLENHGAATKEDIIKFIGEGDKSEKVTLIRSHRK